MKSKKDMKMTKALGKKKDLEKDFNKYMKAAEKFGERAVERNKKDIAKDWGRVGRQVKKDIKSLVTQVNKSDLRLDRKLEGVKRIEEYVTDTVQKWDDLETAMN